MPSGADARTRVGLWIVLIWYGLECTQSLTRWLAIAGYPVAASADILDGSPVDRMAAFVLICAAAVVLLARKTKWLELLTENRLLCALFLYMLLSVLWSDYPSLTFKRWFRTVGDAVMVLVVLTERDPLEARMHAHQACDVRDSAAVNRLHQVFPNDRYGLGRVRDGDVDRKPPPTRMCWAKWR